MTPIGLALNAAIIASGGGTEKDMGLEVYKTGNSAGKWQGQGGWRYREKNAGGDPQRHEATPFF